MWISCSSSMPTTCEELTMPRYAAGVWGGGGGKGGQRCMCPGALLVYPWGGPKQQITALYPTDTREPLGQSHRLCSH